MTGSDPIVARAFPGPWQPGYTTVVATFLLIPGAGGDAWYWHRVVPLLAAAGHRAVAVDLPAADDGAGWTEYRDAALHALDDGGGADGECVVVGQSMGGFTAGLLPQVCRVDRLVLLNAMIPAPGETGGQWWGATGQGPAAAARAEADGRPVEFDPVRDFFHDVPAEVALEAGEPAQSDTPFATPWPASRWPSVPTRVVAGRDDRLFPPEFQRRVARDRLGLEVVEIAGGHLAALARPDAVVQALVRPA